MEDFNQSSLREEIEPMAFLQDSQNRTLHFSFEANDIENWPLAINKIESQWKEFFPDETFKLILLMRMSRNFTARSKVRPPF